MGTTPNPIAGKIIIQGKLVCHSPLHIGSGTKERSELDILLDSQQRPFIPATSLVGALQHAVEISLSAADKNQYRDQFKHFWGYTEEDTGQQSALRCSDLPRCGDEPVHPVIRDGIKIDNTTGIVKEQGKYDYELVERDTCFTLNMELSYRQTEQDFVEKIAATIYAMLTHGEVRLGAKTNSGLGDIQLLEDESTLYHFKFSQKDDIFCWLTKENRKERMQEDWQKQITMVAELKPAFERNYNRLCIDATLRLKNSLIIRSYSSDPKMPDAVHISSKDKPVLTGTSLKGAIRARAERILNTLGKPTDKIINDLFGYVDENQKEAQKSRLRVKEVLLPDYQAEQQTRIKIDRFTGGTIEGALFDSMPLFNDQDQEIQHMQIVVDDCQPYEAGLLLLVLKDLWSGDLAVGGEKNVGRGVFHGIQARITWDGTTFQIQEDLSVHSDQEENPAETLQGYVDALNSEDIQEGAQ